ncbi:MAG: helix-turn-helix transcriptional regulator [Flavobacteriales bacterium]|nr:helix-turn-helix transcriptional regulator [Flavobacteriales bacterium]
MNNSIGNNVRKYRELRGYSQEYMAEKMDITQSAYGKIEKENVKITIDRLQRISEILEVDLGNLINSKNQNIFNLYNNQTANGYIENQYNEMKSTYEKIISDKDDEIKFLRELLKEK